VDIFEGFLKEKITRNLFVTIVLRLIEKRILTFKKEKRVLMFWKEKRTFNLLTALLEVKISFFYSYCNNKNTKKDLQFITKYLFIAGIRMLNKRATKKDG